MFFLAFPSVDYLYAFDNGLICLENGAVVVFNLGVFGKVVDNVHSARYMAESGVLTVMMKN